MLTERSERSVEVEAWRRVKEENVVRARWVPRMSVRGMEKWPLPPSLFGGLMLASSLLLGLLSWLDLSSVLEAGGAMMMGSWPSGGFLWAKREEADSGSRAIR